MKVKTAELIGPALDWAVAEGEEAAWAAYDDALYAEKETPSRPSEYLRDYEFKVGEFSPSSNWAQGGPIIERERIDVLADPNGKDVWMGHAYDRMKEIRQFASTPLIAAMRCYVASKLSDEVEVPDELISE